MGVDCIFGWFGFISVGFSWFLVLLDWMNIMCMGCWFIDVGFILVIL